MRQFLGPKLSLQEAAAKFNLDISKERGWIRSSDKARRQEVFAKTDIVEWTHRPGDRRFVYLSHGLVKEFRKNITPDMLAGPNLVLAIGRGGSNEAPYAWVSRGPMPQAILSQRSHGRAELFPAYRYPVGGVDVSGRRSNMAPEAAAKLAARFGRRPSIDRLFGYVYGVLWSTWWRTDYGALPYQEDDFPRLPMVKQPAKFAAIAKLGLQLIRVHLLQAKSSASNLGVEAVGALEIERWRHNEKREAVEFSDSAALTHITATDVAFTVGGHEVLRQWFESRIGRTLGADDLDYLRKLVGAIRRTPMIQRQLDQELERCAACDEFMVW